MHPILFEIPTPWGAIPIYSYGVMLGTSMILGWSIVMRLGKKERYFRDSKLNEDFLANAFIVCALSALAGSRILYMMTNPGEFDVWSGGQAEIHLIANDRNIHFVCHECARLRSLCHWRHRP